MNLIPLISASIVSVNPSALGGQAGFGVYFQPLPEHELLIGPKISLLAAQGSGLTRVDLNTGVEGMLWILNALGSGLAFDWVAPSTVTGSDSTAHFRIEPTFSVRFFHYKEEGAWALRLGIPYDSAYKWGLEAGISLQFSGVPVIGVLKSEYKPDPT